MPKLQFSRFLIAFSLLAVPLSSRAEPWVRAVPYGPYVQLLDDTAFNDGFRAFMSCKDFEGSSAGLGYTGNCLDYYTPYVNTQGRNYAVRTWPDTGAPSDDGKFWDFNEGVHSGFSIYGYNFPQDSQPPGQYDLQVNRLEANQENNNGVLIASSPSLIWLQAMNNLAPADPNYGGLVRTVSTDRQGNLMMYMNTENEIRNVPDSSGYDTWPHFYLEQNFKEVIDLATLDYATVSLNVSIPFVQTLTGFPGSFVDATASVGVMLRRKDNPAVVVFLGYILYSAIGENERFGGDQWGSAFYDGNNADLGGPIVPGAPARSISFDLRDLMNKAIAFSQGALGPYVLDDYYLASLGVGWETVGYHEVKSEISGASLIGVPKMIFDSEVYEQPPNQPSIYNLWNNGLGWSEGQMRAHWAKYGCHEGRVASTTFDVKVYMDRWGAVGDPTTGNSTSTYNYMPQCYDSNGARDYECAIDHYVIWGRDAGHPGHW
jgi:hypothetical protein